LFSKILLNLFFRQRFCENSREKFLSGIKMKKPDSQSSITLIGSISILHKIYLIQRRENMILDRRISWGISNYLDIRRGRKF
jgi:hypothetical protein